LVVVGGGNSACEESLHLLRYAQKVTMLVRGEKLNASQALLEKLTNHPDIEIHFRTGIEALEGEGGKLKHVKIKNLVSGETETLDPQGMFVFIGQQPNTDFVKGVVDFDPAGFILTGHDLGHSDKEHGSRGMFETSVPAIFAAGDARKGSTKQVASAVGEGAAAVIQIRDYLRMVG
jgi:thioredoxin reductase (NADPH)